MAAGIRLACTDNTFRLVEPWEHVLEMIRLLDIAAVDVCVMGNRSHIRPERDLDDVAATADRITRALAARELEVSDCFCIPWTDFERHAPNHPDEAERVRSDELFGRVLDLAARIGAPGLTILPGIDWPDETHAVSFRRASAVLARRAEAASARGVRFSIEPHLGSIAQDPTEAARLCEETPGLELTLDYSHYVYQGYPDEAAEALVGHARHVHARGARETRMQAPLKDSTIDFERMVAALQGVGYAGDISLEYLWIDWEHLNECDTVSETLLLRDRLRAAIDGTPWSYPASAI